MRTCIGCRSVAPWADLVRVTRDTGGQLRLARHHPGRGAWLCRGDLPGLPADTCLHQAQRRQAFGRAFRASVSTEAVTALHETVEERARIEKGGAVGVVARRD